MSTQATKKLYYEFPYMDSFDAFIISMEPLGDNIYNIILDQTAFFPESGGQESDKGMLAYGQVLHVSIKEDVIIHKVSFDSLPGIKENSQVHCHIDWDFRFSNMQNHTGEHILSGLAKRFFNYENVGFHLSANNVTMDYDGKLSAKDIEKLELWANKTVFSNIPIEVLYPKKEELETLNYRSKLDAKTMKDVRIVKIGDIDICACCAPHVKYTGEIGIIKIVSYENYKSGTRLHILCGSRALEDYSNKHDSLLALSRDFATPISKIDAAIDKLKNELSEKTETIISLETKLLDTDIKNMDSDFPVLFTNVSNAILFRNKINDLVKCSEFPVIAFNGDDSSGYQLIISSETSDSNEVFNKLKSHIEIKGGGTSQMIQGKTSALKSEIENALRFLMQ